MSSNTDESVQMGNLVRVKTPTSISLVGLPANQTAFKVVRADGAEGTTPAATDEGSTKRRVRRSALNPIMRLAFGKMDTEEMNSILKDYGMEDYTISAEGDCVVATRADLQSFAKEGAESIRLQRGVIAYVEKPPARVKRADSKQSLRLSAFEFSPEHFDVAAANAWLVSHAVDISVEDHENPAVSYVAKRSGVESGAEVRRMEIEEGVIAAIVLDAVLDVPESVIKVVSEAAYGNWGWGQLDFQARLADHEFCEAMSEAIELLEDTLQYLMFYSNLPLDVRQQLTTNALAQFNDYTIQSMSVLPRQVLVAVSRAEARKEPPAVTTKTTNIPETVDVDQTPVSPEPTVETTTTTVPLEDAGKQEDSTPPVVVTGTDAAGETVTLTRAQIDELVSAEIAKRADLAVAAALAPPVEDTTTPAVEGTSVLLERMDALAARIEALQGSQTEAAERLVRMEKGVVIRSDIAGTNEALLVQSTPANVQQADPWVGVFGSNTK